MLFGTNIGAGVGVGLGVGAGVRLGVGAGVGLGVGAGVGLGVGAGVELGFGAGVGLGVGTGVGFTRNSGGLDVSSPREKKQNTELQNKKSNDLRMKFEILKIATFNHFKEVSIISSGFKL